MSRAVYVVLGNTGEYSDHRTWLVKAFTTEEAAKEHVRKALEWARSVGVSRREWCAISWEKRDAIRKSNPFDPNMEWDYTGTDYTYTEVELAD